MGESHPTSSIRILFREGFSNEPEDLVSGLGPSHTHLLDERCLGMRPQQVLYALPNTLLHTMPNHLPHNLFHALPHAYLLRSLPCAYLHPLFHHLCHALRSALPHVLPYTP